MSGGQSQSRRTVSRAAKTIIAEEEGDKRHQDLCQLPAQGEMARSWEKSSPDLWVKAVQGLPPEPLKFALNASPNTLPLTLFSIRGERSLETPAPFAESTGSLFSIF